jgi:hypothetical protein
MRIQGSGSRRQTRGQAANIKSFTMERRLKVNPECAQRRSRAERPLPLLGARRYWPEKYRRRSAPDVPGVS